MCKIAFQVQGNISVNGVDVSNEHGALVMLEGKIATSGCNDAAIARNIGLKNIASAVGSQEVLDSVDLDAIAEYITDNGLYEALMAKMMGYQDAA